MAEPNPNPLLAKTDVQFVVFDLEESEFAIIDLEGQTTPMKPISFPSTFSPTETCRYYFSSCNGLVCFFSVNNYTPDIYLCNPTIGECVSVPKPSIDAPFHSEIYDLGFAPSSNQYKLTRFVRRKFDDETTELEIYTFGSPDGWRRHAGEVPSRIWNKAEGAICAQGVLHWLLSPNPNNKRCILTLDLAEEKFGSVPLPRVGDEKRIYSLGYMDECLVVTAGHNPPLGLEIWAMGEEGPLWTKNAVIDATESLNNKTLDPMSLLRLIPRKLSTDGWSRIFMTDLDTRLYCYDEDDRIVTLTSKGTRPWPSLMAYTTSSVSPNQLMQDTSSLPIDKKIIARPNTGQERED